MPEAEPQIEPRRRVCREADPGGVAQRYEAAVADQEVQARGENCCDKDLAGEIDVELSADQWKAGQRHPQNNPRRLRAANHALRLPKSPLGRNAITTIIGRNRMT